MSTSGSRFRVSAVLIVGTCLLMPLAACGGDDSGSDGRRSVGQPQAESPAGQLPEDHPEIPGMGERSGEGEAVRRDLPPAVAVRIDSGNVAYRAGDYEAARRHFRAAAREDTTVGAAWFGVYMAERALGNAAAADSALQRAGALDDPSGVHGGPGEDGGEATDEMPHPPVESIPPLESPPARG